ncbi:FAD-dependent oxidoreductase [Mycobacterium sp. NPDC003449]
MRTFTNNSRDVFDRLVRTGPTVGDTPAVIDTACVLGGSISGLLAARVLADHARTVVVVERDEVTTEGRSRAGVPQDRQAHVLIASGLSFLDRWFPGFTQEALKLGGVLSAADQRAIYVGGRLIPDGGSPILAGTRPFLESLIRSRVLAIRNVRSIKAAATGLEIRDNAVRGVHYAESGSEKTMNVDFVVDAMGRPSRLGDWVEQAGFQHPPLMRHQVDISYATALFERAEDARVLPINFARALPSDPLHPETPLAMAFAVEKQQWLVLLFGYGDHRPPKSIEAFRAACATLPTVFGQAAAGPATGEVQTYRQMDSRRRDFTGLARYPGRLISVGDAVACFNPEFGQGMSAAALHANCLSEYLLSGPELDLAADKFFALQSVVVDCAWIMSDGSDAARMDAINGVDVPDDVKRQRWALDQVQQAAGVDDTVATALAKVRELLAHPSTLTDPALLTRAVAVNQQQQR